MAVKLRPLYQALLVFGFIFTMYNAAHFDVNSSYGVQNNQTVSVQEEYNDLQENVKSDDSDNKGLLEKMKTLSNPAEDPFASIGAGLFILPQLVGVLTAPLSIASSIVMTIGGALAGIIPSSVPAYVLASLTFAVVFALIEIALRLREV